MRKGLLSLLLVLWGVPGVAAEASIVTSFSVLQSLVGELAPAETRVSSLVPRGEDVHHFELSTKDLVRLKSASLIFRIGAEFDSWVPKALKLIKAPARDVVLTQGMKLRPGGHHGKDPHVWLDPGRSREMAKLIAKEMKSSFPAKADEIARKEESLLRRLSALDLELKRGFASLPPERRRVVVPHAAFGYFEEAYGIAFISPYGWSTDVEPTAKDLARIIREVKTSKAVAILGEEGADQKVIRQIARETGLKVGGLLLADSLSEASPDYFSLMRNNAKVLLDALKAP